MCLNRDSIHVPCPDLSLFASLPSVFTLSHESLSQGFLGPRILHVSAEDEDTLQQDGGGRSLWAIMFGSQMLKG